MRVYAVRHSDFIQKFMTKEGITKLNKEYSFVCDISRQDGSLLIGLEQLIDDLQPADLPRLSLRGQERIPLKFVRHLAYIISWSLWGRAISSLDFVELSVRKPSLKRLLTNWAKFVTILIIKGREVMDAPNTGATD